MEILTPYVLLITGGIVIYFINIERKLFFYLWCSITYIITVILEIIGVKTGIIFGDYSYGHILGISLYGVPLIIGFNWVMIITAIISIAQSVDKNIFLTALLSATLAVLFDIILEPVAVKLNYWYWEGNIIPLKNYFSWFGIAFFFSILASCMKLKIRSIFLEHYFLIQLMFFVLLSLFI